MLSKEVLSTLRNPPQPITYLRVGNLVLPYTLDMLSRRIKRLGGLYAEVVTQSEDNPIKEYWSVNSE